jgi:hypothetical protein
MKSWISLRRADGLSLMFPKKKG